MNTEMTYIKIKNKTLPYILTLTLTIIFLLSLTLTALAQTATITGSVVNIRSGPGTNNAQTGTVLQDTAVNILDEENGWYKIQFGQITGWVSATFVKANAPTSPDLGQVKVTNGPINVREQPNTSSAILGKAQNNTPYKLVAEENDWYKIQFNNTTGYVAAWLVEKVAASTATPTPPTPTPTPPSINNTDAPIVYLDTAKLEFEVAPMIENGRTLVPLRAIFEAMGATVSWNDATKTVIATRGNDSVVLTIGSNRPIVNGNEVEIDVPAKIVQDRTLAPLRFVGEAFGGKVDWNEATRTISMTSPTNNESTGKKANTVIVASKVNLRTGPDLSYKDIDQALPGEKLAILDEKDGWYQVSRGGVPAWVAGWVVDVAWVEGESPPIPDPTPEPEPKPPTPKPEEVKKDELKISYTNDTEGIILKMSSGARLAPEIEKTSTAITYTYEGLSLEGLNFIKQKVGSDEVKMRGINENGNAIISVEIPRGLEFSLETLDNGKTEAIIIPNFIMSIDRKPFGKTGERLLISTMSEAAYTKKQEGAKVIIELDNMYLGQARTEYKYSSSIIENISLQEIDGKTPKVIMTINANDLGQSSAGIGTDGALNIMLRGKSEVRQVRENLVLLDAGHGGKDTGARGKTINEKDVTLDITLQVGNLLKQKGYEVDYIRTEDTYIAPEERPLIANRINPAIFVSIHINSALVNTAMGIETYYYAPETNPDLFLQREEREKLARCVQTKLISKLKRPDRGAKPGNYAVLRNSNMPSILTEVMFINNETEEALLKQGQIRTLAAQAIAEGIDEYMRGR